MKWISYRSEVKQATAVIQANYMRILLGGRDQAKIYRAQKTYGKAWRIEKMAYQAHLARKDDKILREAYAKAWLTRYKAFMVLNRAKRGGANETI